MSGAHFLGHTGEAAIVAMFQTCAQAPAPVDPRLPFNQALDTVVYEFAMPFGRADIVIFHIDGTATVVEVKDGTRGYMHVAQGVGQVGLYAAQLSLKRNGLKRIRRALLWTSTGSTEADVALEVACELAGVIALPWATLSAHIAALTEAMERTHAG